MPIFTNPAAIWGTLVFLGLIAVYIYRRRSRNIVLSTIMFFSKSKSTAEGGQKLHKLQTPIIFYIEILIFLLFILALANPVSLHRGQLVPVTVILDDSLSMTAGGKSSPQNMCMSYLKSNIFSNSLYSITLIKAGEKPLILGRRDMNGTEAESVLRGWKCESVNSNLMVAVSQTIEMKTEDTVILVLTDHLNNKSTSEAVKWVSFGTSKDNLAITSANRNSNGRIDRCFFEFTNFSSKTQELNAEIVDTTNNKVLERVNASLTPKSSRRIVVKTHDQDSIIKASLMNDDVDYDNEVVLLSTKRDKLKVALNLNNDFMSQTIKKAVLSSDMAVINSQSPQIIISDKKNKNKDSVVSQLVIHQATQTFSLIKSFAADKNYFITSDLPFENGIWVADPNFKPVGKVILISGNIPLLCVDEESDRYKTVYLNYCFDKSTMHQTIFWPVFFYNILEWSLQYTPGPSAYNYKSGSKIVVRAEKDSSKILLKRDSENKAEVKEGYVNDGKAMFVAGKPGLYQLEDGEKKYEISVNLCSYEESDLSNLERTKTLPEIVSDEKLSHFESVKWWFIMAAFVLLLIHQWLISKRRVGYAF